MSAIITSNFRLENANNFKASIADANNSVYVFIGKSDRWDTSLSGTTDTPPTTTNTLVEQNDAWKGMIAMKKVTASDSTNLIPRYDWLSGTVYTPWDDTDQTLFIDSAKKFYMITDQYKVYKCITAPASGAGSTVKPIQTNLDPTSESDGYTWKYMYTVNSTDLAKFLVNSYIPVKTLKLPVGEVFSTWYAALSAEDKTQYDNQVASADNAGKIYRLVVDNAGSGYTPGSHPTVTIYGDGVGATAQATVGAGGTVTSIAVTNPGTSPYNAVWVTIAAPSSGTTATAKAVLSPPNGHGTDPVSELGGFYSGISVSLRYNDGGDFIVDNAFRQIGIVKNPTDYGTSTVSSAPTRNALKSITLSAYNSIIAGDYITGADSSAKAYVDSYDIGTGVLKYHQNDKTGYGTFSVGENLSSSSGGTGTIDAGSSLHNPEVQPFSGQILFLENRAKIDRSASQIEDVKIILEF